jgi:hypothetical protein
MGYMWIHTSMVEAEYMGGYIWVDMDAYFQGRSSIYIGRVYRWISIFTARPIPKDRHSLTILNAHK